MEKPEIIDGLRNAVQRGYSMDVAVSSFINAGYNKQDVLDSANALGGSFTSQSSAVQSQQNQPQTILPSPPQNHNFQEQLSQTENKAIVPSSQSYQSQQPIKIQNKSPQVITPPRKKGWGIVIALIVILVLLLGVLGTIIFAKDLVLSWLAKLGI